MGIKNQIKSSDRATEKQWNTNQAGSSFVIIRFLIKLKEKPVPIIFYPGSDKLRLTILKYQVKYPNNYEQPLFKGTHNENDH
jgi:hypothetical protein